MVLVISVVHSIIHIFVSVLLLSDKVNVLIIRSLDVLTKIHIGGTHHFIKIPWERRNNWPFSLTVINSSDDFPRNYPSTNMCTRCVVKGGITRLNTTVVASPNLSCIVTHCFDGAKSTLPLSIVTPWRVRPSVNNFDTAYRFLDWPNCCLYACFQNI